MVKYARAPEPHTSIPRTIAAVPAITIGMLAPVPFLYAALRVRSRKLWLTAALYGVVWIGAWVCAASLGNGSANLLCGFAFMALAAAGTTHAFVLRESLLSSRNGRCDTAAQQLCDVFAPATDPQNACAQQLRSTLVSLRTYMTTNERLFPPACNQLISELFAQVEQVLSFVANDHGVNADLSPLKAVLTDYLPTSINAYVRLPQEYVSSQRNPDGRTAAEELELQLTLLRDGALETANYIYRCDALHLQEQSAFLQAKFGKSELDLS